MSIKIHEIAKKLNLNSKEVLEKAKKLGFDVKSHLSSVSEEVADKIENSIKNAKNVIKKEENKKERDSRACYY